MDNVSRVMGHYRHEKHFLQSVNIGNADLPFMHMKNHKAACSTVLATLISLLDLRAGAELRQTISNEEIHKPYKSRLRTGPRELTLVDALETMADRQVFRFSVVRDPFRRVLSAYADELQDGMKPKIWLMKYIKRPLDGEMSLPSFLVIVAHDPGALDVDRHWRRQCDEIAFDFVNYNFIGRVEELQRAMDFVARAVFRVSSAPLQDTRETLRHQTQSSDLLAQLSKQDLKNIEKAYGTDLAMYAEVSKMFGEYN